MMVVLFLIALAVAFEDDPVAPDPKAVAAMVNGTPVLEQDVARELTRILKGRQLDAQTLDRIHAELVQQLIDQRLIAQSLSAKKLWASEQDVDVAANRLEKQLLARGQTLDDFLVKNKLDRAALRRQLAWQNGWGRYLERQFTDANIEKYFNDHRWEYDGTRLKVAQILLPVEGQDAKQLEAALATAQKIRKQIVDGGLSFAAAAMQHSTGPSAKLGGELGFIGRREPMPDAFSKVAYSTEQDKVSEPVVTTFGVHLIQWTESKAGQKTWFDVQDELKQDMTMFLFRRIADRERKTAKIELKENP